MRETQSEVIGCNAARVTPDDTSSKVLSPYLPAVSLVSLSSCLSNKQEKFKKRPNFWFVSAYQYSVGKPVSG